MDWQVFHDKLLAATRAAPADTDPERVRACLEERAAALSCPAAPVEPESTLEVLLVRLGRETYALETTAVREIQPLKSLTPVPCTPNFVLGVTYLRGEFIAATDIRTFFDLPEQGLTDLNRLVILESKTMLLGVVVDELLGLDILNRHDIEPAPTTWNGIRREYIKGLAAAATIVLDAEKLLSDDRLRVDDQAAGSSGR